MSHRPSTAGPPARARSARATGASSGIGAAVARRPAEGRRLVVNGRDATRLERVADRAPATASPADPTRPGGDRRPAGFEPERTGPELPVANAGADRAGDSTAMPRTVVYPAATAGIGTLADAPRHELPDTGVGVPQVIPGVVDTAFADRRGVPRTRSRPRPVSWARVADAVRRAVREGWGKVSTPGRPRLPARPRGPAPGLCRRLAARFG